MSTAVPEHIERDLASHLAETAGLDEREFLTWALRRFGTGLAFASSLGAEDQALLHLLDGLLSDLRLPSYSLEAFTLDTGRLHQETHDLLQKNRELFRIPIRLYFPDSAEVEAMVAELGPNGFYASIEARKACCAVRKVAPLKRALAGKQAWITGLRRDQAVSRIGLERVEWDASHGLWKLNPLIDWDAEQVAAYNVRHQVPVSVLHARGFPSIGCQPCTRAIKAGEDERAGRWWWENPEHKECGLHVQPQTGAPGADKPMAKVAGIGQLKLQ